MALPGALTQYALQSTVMAAGVMHVTLYSDQAGLVIPSMQTLRISEDDTEKLDVLPGVVEMQEYVFHYIEDYSTYPEGFWQRVLSSYFEIRLFLDEGAGDTFFFWGRYIPETSGAKEIDLTVGAIAREGDFRCRTLFDLMKEVPFSDIATARVLFDVSISTVNGTAYGQRIVDVRSILAKILQLTFFGRGQEFDRTYVTLPANEDVQLSPDNTSWYGLDNFWIQSHNVDGSVDIGVFQATWWPTLFGNCFDLFTAICKTFGLVARYRFDVAAGKHKIDLLSRGRSYSSYSTPITPVESTLFPGTELYLTKMVVTPRSGIASQQWMSGGSAQGSGQTPVNFTADLTITTELETTNGAAYPGVVMPPNILLYYPGSGTDAQPMRYSRAWLYSTAGYLSDNFQRCLLFFWFNRYVYQKRGYERTYPGLKCNNGTTNSHANASILRETQINDGVSTRNFYATEVRKNPSTNRLFVRWQEI